MTSLMLSRSHGVSLRFAPTVSRSQNLHGCHRLFHSTKTLPTTTTTTSLPKPPPSSSSSSSSSKTPFLTYAGAATLYTLTIFSIGYDRGRTDHEKRQNHVFPSGSPRTCCSSPGTTDPLPLLRDLRTALRDVDEHCTVLTPSSDPYEMDKYCRGARLGHGTASAIIQPTSLTSAVTALRTVLRHDCVVIPQGANTGLTGGSTPRGGGSGHSSSSSDDDPSPQKHRDAVIISTRHLQKILPVDDGCKVLCAAGVGIGTLSQHVSQKFDRESHSILGSTFLNPSVAAGVAYGSGGTQLRYGPAFTNRALYARVGGDGRTVEVVNTLGIKGLEGEDVLERLDKLLKEEEGKEVGLESAAGAGLASDVSYRYKVCDCESADVARYNADTSGCDANRSEGKVLILATVNDTFEKPSRSRSYWVSCSDLETALALRKDVVLNNPDDLPKSCEYMDRDAFDVVDRSGRIAAAIIANLGMTHWLIRSMWDWKLYVEGLPLPYADVALDKLMHWFNYAVFPPLNPTLMRMGRDMDHHLMITVGDYGDTKTMDNFDERLRQFVRDKNSSDDPRHPPKIQLYDCTPADTSKITAFRFVAATAFRTYCVGSNLQGISVDYALPKNDGRAPSLLDGGGGGPKAAATTTTTTTATNTDTPAYAKRMRYSHFGCNVVHEDLAYPPGVNVHDEKMNLKKVVERECRGRLPAEHGHGMEYEGSEEAKARWRRMDPANVMNPGIGGLSAARDYK